MFVRPDSPPPRQPSPDFVPAPLPSPPVHSRLRNPSARALTPSVPPGLHKQLLSTRSCDQLGDRIRQPHCRLRTQSTHKHAPRSLPSLSPPHTPVLVPHARTPAHTVSRSPPPSPTTVSTPPPPVPPIPAFMLPSTDSKPIAQPRPINLSPFRFSEFDNISAISTPSDFLPKRCPPQPQPEKHKGVGMTCLRFFSLNRKGTPRTATV
ncbi:hypothetical protein BD779DRAFT_1491979 [Infundibulicybe gibba]|nr:hypothetical protein BD779DRAFT_1491979 [Infundibulicybe gibba]